MTDFECWLQAKMKAIDDELGVTPSSKWDTLRVVSLRSQWAKYREAFCIHLEYKEAMNAQST